MVTSVIASTVKPVRHLPPFFMLVPGSPFILIGFPHVPSEDDADTFCDIHFTDDVAFVCHPFVVPFPVGIDGSVSLSL